MLTTVISGGQTGVDIAALRAAQAVGLATGGWMPRGWRTLTGPRPEYAARYGLRAHASPAYPPRTHQNVADADATLRLAVDFASAGERCTREGVVKHRRPSHDVGLDAGFVHLRLVLAAADDDPIRRLLIDDVVEWMREKNVTILNVAGNSEFTAPGIEAAAEAYLRTLFRAARRTPW